MIEKWVNFKRDYLEISFLREKWVCAISPYHRRYMASDIMQYLKLAFKFQSTGNWKFNTVNPIMNVMDFISQSAKCTTHDNMPFPILQEFID